jgi:hypothetical protein
MDSGDLQPDLQQAQRTLSASADSLSAAVLAVDESRAGCYRLAARFEDLARRSGRLYPSLAGPASALAALHRDLGEALGRLNDSAGGLVATSGRLADSIAHMGATGADGLR